MESSFPIDAFSAPGVTEVVSYLSVEACRPTPEVEPPDRFTRG
jgi:hypothetical protein